MKPLLFILGLFIIAMLGVVALVIQVKGLSVWLK